MLGYRRRLLGLRVEELRLAGPEQWLVRAGKALLQAVPIAQVPASSLQALGMPGACLFLVHYSAQEIKLNSGHHTWVMCVCSSHAAAFCKCCLHRRCLPQSCAHLRHAAQQMQQMHCSNLRLKQAFVGQCSGYYLLLALEPTLHMAPVAAPCTRKSL